MGLLDLRLHQVHLETSTDIFGSLHELHASIHAPNAEADNEAKTKAFCAKIIDIAERNGTTKDLVAHEKVGYLYGSTPTALDAHTLVFLGRIQDTKRIKLIPDVLISWIDKFRKHDIWKSVVTLEGYSTIPPHAARG